MSKKKTKYILMYAKDVKLPPQPGNTITEEFSSRFGFWWFLVRNKAARDAVKTDRFQFLVVKD